MRARFLFALLLAAPALPQQPPYLYLRQLDKNVSNNTRIRLQVCVRARSVSDRFEQPDLVALNQAPGYFDHRPPPNIKLSVRHITASGRQEVRFRTFSSGGGKDLAVYYVNADIDVLEEKTLRQQRAEQFVDWMISQPGAQRLDRLVQNLKPQLAEQFEDQYVNNPPGDYEITARYTPSTAENWKGVLVAAPFRLRVIDAGDFFDVMKAKVAAGAEKRP